MESSSLFQWAGSVRSVTVYSTIFGKEETSYLVVDTYGDYAEDG